MSDIETKVPVESLAQEWAKKYLQSLQIDTSTQPNSEVLNLSELISPDGREKTAKKILESLRAVSAKAWNKTELLLAEEIKKHRIDASVINPWEVAGDSFKIYEKTLQVYTQSATQPPLYLVTKPTTETNSLDETTLQTYTQQLAPQQLTTAISAEIGLIRKKYTNIDPRVIGFVSMQFHYTSQMLIEQLDYFEQELVSTYFKVIDDHLYMPLQRAYEAAAQHDYNSPVLSAVRKLLPASTDIATKIAQRVIEFFPNYQSMSGLLSNPVVKISSIRDVEMFQVYLWVCALEGNLDAIQQELFPLCIMLYPRLNVQWELVRQMLHLLRHEICERLDPQQANILMPFFQALSQMFSSDVLD